MEVPSVPAHVMADRLTLTPSDGRSVPGGDSRGHPLSGVASLTGILASLGVSGLAYGPLPAKMRIHWSFGGPYIGPEFAPTWLILLVFPVLVATVALGLYSLRISLQSHEAFSAVRPFYGLLTVSMVGMLLVVQVGIVLVNLL